MPKETLTASFTGFGPKLLANVALVCLVVLSSWRVVDLFVVYVVEIAVLLLVYAVAALFAQRPLVAEGRNLTLPGVSRQQGRDESRWGGDPWTVTLSDALPPLYPRNVRLVWMSLVWGFGFLALPVLALEYTVTPTSKRGALLLGTVFVLTALHIRTLRREYFGRKHHERMSVHMVLEVPGRVVAFWAIALALLVVLGGASLFALYAIQTQTGVELLDELVFVAQGIVICGKSAVDWLRYQAETASDPNALAAWFRPEDPLSE